jgi:hypothetical protein
MTFPLSSLSMSGLLSTAAILKHSSKCPSARRVLAQDVLHHTERYREMPELLHTSLATGTCSALDVAYVTAVAYT